MLMISKFNNRLAEMITNKVGTMYCAYLFAIIGIAGVYYALTSDAKGVLIIGSVSGYFLQLVLLPIIMVGQGIQADKTEQLHKTVKKIHSHLKKQSN